MLVRIVRPWMVYRVGRVLNMPDGAANVLIRRNIAELAEAESAKAADPPAVRQEEQPQHGRRKRVRSPL